MSCWKPKVRPPLWSVGLVNTHVHRRPWLAGGWPGPPEMAVQVESNTGAPPLRESHDPVDMTDFGLCYERILEGDSPSPGDRCTFRYFPLRCCVS